MENYDFTALYRNFNQSKDTKITKQNTKPEILQAYNSARAELNTAKEEQVSAAVLGGAITALLLRALS